MEGAEDGSFEVKLESEAIAYQVYLNVHGGLGHRVSDNFFDLFPGESKFVTLRLSAKMTVTALEKAHRIYSYRDSYDD